MNSGEHVWMQPLGDGDELRRHPRLAHLDLPALGGSRLGGPLVTKTLLIGALSDGGSDGGPSLVARDKASGEVVAAVDYSGVAKHLEGLPLNPNVTCPPIQGVHDDKVE